MKGIVFRTIKYGDSSLIVDMFTESHGRMSFIAKQTHTRRSTTSTSSAFWQPLSLVEFEADIRPTAKQLPKPKDVRLYHNYSSLTFSPVKSAITLFLAEFLSAALREEKQNVPLYKYIENSLLWFDEAQYPAAIANFHLVFIMHLTQFIGIYPNLELNDPEVLSLRGRDAHRAERGFYFDLLSGTYTTTHPSHPHIINKEEAQLLPTLFRLNYQTMHLYKMSSAQRRRLLEGLNTFFRLHLPNFPELKSIEVLHEVFA